MNLRFLKQTARFIILIALQVVLLNQVYLGGFITPFLYPLIVMLLPFDTKGWALLLTAFAAGLSIDMFTDSMGMHAAATTFLAYARPWIINLISARTDYEPGTEPGLAVNSLTWLILYTLISVFIHHLFLFSVEVFRFDEWWQIFIRTLLSTIFSSILIIISFLLFSRQSDRRR